jgi:ribosomal protein S27AE
MAITKAMGLQEPEVRKTLYSIITKNLEGAVEVRVSGTLVDDAAELELAPTSLLSGLWLQLALAVVEKKNVQFCRSCGRAILLATNEDGRQARRQFCGNACKVRGYRERKAQDAQD